MRTFVCILSIPVGVVWGFPSKVLDLSAGSRRRWSLGVNRAPSPPRCWRLRAAWRTAGSFAAFISVSSSAFSERIENHFRAVALRAMYYNFVRIHQILRIISAMAAGMTERVWEMSNLIEMLGPLSGAGLLAKFLKSAKHLYSSFHSHKR
jgi:hypothetical protein